MIKNKNTQIPFTENVCLRDTVLGQGTMIRRNGCIPASFFPLRRQTVKNRSVLIAAIPTIRPDGTGRVLLHRYFLHESRIEDQKLNIELIFLGRPVEFIRIPAVKSLTTSESYHKRL